MAKRTAASSGERANHKKTAVSPKTGKNNKKIEERAFEIYAKRVSSGEPGNELSDWVQAESEFRADEE